MSGDVMRGPDFLVHVVANRTTLPERYLASAAHQSMSAYLVDWEQAYERLGRQIMKLRDARDARKADAEAGLWPPRRVVEGPESQVAPGQLAGEERPAPSTVPDLVAALEESLRVAKTKSAEAHSPLYGESQ